MKAEPNLNLVHESETQRQHVRVRLPGIVEFGAGKDHCRFKLHDISAGGLSFDSPGRPFRPGELYRGNVSINLDGIAIALNVSFTVRNFDAANGRTGCAFKELAQKEIVVLRHLIGAFLSGEMLRVDDVLQTLKRDNFTKPRNASASGSGPRRSRTGALMLTLLFAAGGALAFVTAGQQLNRMLFMTTATAAKVAGPVYLIEMPREGSVRSLIPEDGIVRKGVAIASIEAPALDLLRQQALGSDLSPEQMQKMLGVKVKGTITSPCDCRVQTRFVNDEQYVSRGEPLFELIPLDYKPYIIARFRYDQVDELEQGASVRFHVNGDDGSRIGRITRIRAAGQGDDVDGDVLVTIEPAEPLAPELMQRPASVATGGLPGLQDLGSLFATQTANATNPEQP